MPDSQENSRQLITGPQAQQEYLDSVNAHRLDPVNMNTPDKFWADQVSHCLNIAPGGVFLVTAPCTLDAFAASWYYTISCVYYDDPPKPLYTRLVHIVPIAKANRNIHQSFISSLRASLTRKAVALEKIDDYLHHIEFQWFTSNSAQSVLDAIEALDDGTAIAISRADLFRFADSPESDITNVSTWTGVNIRLVTNADVYLHHLGKFAKECVRIAERKRLHIVLFCEVSENICNLLTEALKLETNIAIVGFNSFNGVDDQVLFDETLSNLSKIGLDSAISTIENRVKDPIKRHFYQAGLHFVAGKFGRAWQIVEPHLNELVGRNDPSSLLTLARIAISAGQTEKAKEFVAIAKPIELDSMESLVTALNLAFELSLGDLVASILEVLDKTYPECVAAKVVKLKLHMRNRRFAAALPIAESLQDQYLVHLCRAFEGADLDVDDLFAYAETSGNKDCALLAAARESKARGNYPQAQEWAASVPSESELFADSIELRLSLLGKQIANQQEVTEDQVSELRTLLTYTAYHPENVALRFSIQRLVEDDLPAPVAHILLLAVFTRAVEDGYLVEREKLPSDKDWWDQVLPRPPDDEMDELLPFFKKFIAAFKDSGIFIGLGSLPPELEVKCTLGLLKASIYLLQYSATPSDYNCNVQILHMIVLIAKLLKDPNADFLAYRHILALYATHGSPQASRDLAETALITLARNQPEHGDWRLKQSWLCYAESFERSGNSFGALQCACMAFLISVPSPTSVCLLRYGYRLACRIFRDLHYFPGALRMLEIEREICTETGMVNRIELSRLDEVELSICICAITEQTEVSSILELLERAWYLFQHHEEEEKGPILSCVANLIRVLHLRGSPVPEPIIKDFLISVNALPEATKNLLLNLINVTPCNEDLVTALKRIASANSMRDFSAQLASVNGLAASALGEACKTGDNNLFVTSFGVLCRPEPVKEFSTTDTSPRLGKPGLADVWWISQIRDKNATLESIVDSLSVLRSVAPIQPVDATKLLSLQSQQVTAILQADEVLLALAHDSTHTLCRALFSRQKPPKLERVETGVWSSDRLSEWRRKFPRGYSWVISSDWLPVESVTTEEVTESIDGLAIGDIPAKCAVTIAAESCLFGFPFPLCLDAGIHIGALFPISTIPSLQWLKDVREKAWQGGTHRCAWFGPRDTQDLTLLKLLDTHKALLMEQGFSVSRDEKPTGMKFAEMAIVGSHGVSSLFDHFAGVSDACKLYNLDEFADCLSGCGCVVLFVCSAGRSDSFLDRAHTDGLVLRLLDAGVRCVVAPPWPLNIKVTEIWLPVFLEAISRVSINHAAFEASAAVRAVYDNPCAWASLQVYGDGLFRIPSHSN